MGVKCDRIGRFLKVLGDKISKNSPKRLATPGALLKNLPLTSVMTLLEHFLETFGLFLLQHLVTLVASIFLPLSQNSVARVLNK